MFMIDFSVDSDNQRTHWEEPKADVSCGSGEGRVMAVQGGEGRVMAVQGGEGNRTDQSTLA